MCLCLCWGALRFFSRGKMEDEGIILFRPSFDIVVFSQSLLNPRPFAVPESLSHAKRMRYHCANPPVVTVPSDMAKSMEFAPFYINCFKESVTPNFP